MDQGSYQLAYKMYRYIRKIAAEKDSMDQLEIAYICGLAEGLLIKNGYEGEGQTPGNTPAGEPGFQLSDLVPWGHKKP